MQALAFPKHMYYTYVDEALLIVDPYNNIQAMV